MRYSALIIIILHFFGKKLENVYNLCIFAKRNSTELFLDRGCNRKNPEISYLKTV